MKMFAKRGCVIAIWAVVVVLTGCGGKKTASGEYDSDALALDNAIKQAAARIDERIEAGTKIALLNFKSPSDRFSEYFISELEANLLDNGKLTIIDRKEIDLIRSEMIFQTSGEVSDESIQKIGQKLGAQSIVSGSLMEIGKTYRVVVRVLNVETAAVAAQYRNDIRNDDRVQALLADRRPTNTPATSGISYMTEPKRPTAIPAAIPPTTTENAAVTTAATTENASAPAPAPAPATENKPAPALDPNKVYKIGDTGPAGGLIFYDKGNNQGGWRYMEAAPANTEKKFAWWIKRYLNEIPKTNSNGKINTTELMEYVNENCGIYNTELPAIHYCNTLEINGYNDWFLPSQEELQLMCRNLHIRGLGKFSSEWYWSSIYAGNCGACWRGCFGGTNFNDGKNGWVCDGGGASCPCRSSFLTPRFRSFGRQVACRPYETQRQTRSNACATSAGMSSPKKSILQTILLRMIYIGYEIYRRKAVNA